MDAAWNRINNFANNTFEIDEIVYYMWKYFLKIIITIHFRPFK